MLREIHIDKFNKIISQFKPEVFSSLTILEAKPYNQTVEFYTGMSAVTQPTMNTRTTTKSTIRRRKSSPFSAICPSSKPPPKYYCSKRRKKVSSSRSISKTISTNTCSFRRASLSPPLSWKKSQPGSF